MNKAIFIDRDGTLVLEVGYLKMIEDLQFTYKATEALRRFQDSGFLNIVITNQSAVARGILSMLELDKIHQSLRNLAKEEGAIIDDILFCPHFSEGRVAPYNIDCDCRKPKIGMISKAQQKYGLDLSHSFLVGDKVTDLQMASNAGIQGILVLTGYGEQTRMQWDKPVEVFPNLYEFSGWLKAANDFPPPYEGGG